MSDEHLDDVAAALAAGETIERLRGAVHRESDATPFVMTEDGPSSLDALLTNPVRRRATVAIRDAASFIAYVQAYADANSLVFANIADRTITAILDYHLTSTGSARWGQHRAVLTCLLTEDWKRWTGANKKRMSQADFAQFLEDNLPNIAEPPGARILEIAKALEAKKSVNFKSSVRLDNGEHQLTYEETVQGQAKGQIEIPQTFTLGLEPFEGAEKYRLEARYRYRIENGKLEMWFDLVRHEAVVEDAFRETRKAIGDAIKPVKVLAAAAPTIA